MNIEGIGKPLALIISDKELKKGEKKDKPRVISVEPDPKKVQFFLPTIDVKEHEHIQLCPNTDQERDILYITGASGSGKSFFTKKYLEQYHHTFPKRPIYMFSSLNDDKTLDSIKYLKRVQLTPELLSEDLGVQDFKDSLVIFDDTDCLQDKRMKLKINGILNVLLETGRHYNVSLIYTSHLATAGNDTKRILNECNSITIFPASLGGRTLKYLLESYLGLDKHQIKKIKKTDSRAITICKSFPMIVLENKKAYCIKDIEN